MARRRKDFGAARFDWLHHIEIDPSRSGFHVHAALRGSVPPHAWWEEHTARRGLGICDVSPIRTTRGFAAYVMKDLLDPELDQSSLAAVVAANEGRLHHHSRGFFLGRSGLPVGGLKPALAEIAAERDRERWGLRYAPPGSIAESERLRWQSQRDRRLGARAAS